MLSLVTPPTEEPVTLQQAKDQVLQGLAYDDAKVGQIFIPASRDRAELHTGRALITQTWDLVLDCFPCGGYIEIPKPPLQSVTFLKYRDTQGTLQTWATSNYVVEAPAGPRAACGRLALAYGVTWPSTYGQQGDITVRFVCGYGAALDVPPGLKIAILVDVAALYAAPENPEPPAYCRNIYWAHRAHPTQRRAA